MGSSPGRSPGGLSFVGDLAASTRLGWCEILLLIAALLAPRGHAAAWINPSGGTWNEPTNWSGGLVPVEGEVTISLAGSYTITNLTDVTLSRLVLDNPDAVLAGPGSLRITNLFEWRAGSLGAPSTALLIAEGGLSMNGTSLSPRRLQRTLINLGEATWVDQASLQWSAGAILTNASSGVFRILGPGRLDDGEGKGLWANAGVLRKESPGDLFVPTLLRNSGVLEIAAGTLQMSRGLEQNGELRIADGARLALVAGTHAFAASSVTKGAGELKVTGGTTTLDGNVELTGPQLFQGGAIQLNGQRLAITNLVLVSSGQVSFGGTYSFISNLVAVVGGTANFLGNGTIAPASLVISNLGVLGGDQSLDVSEVVQIGLGTMRGSGSVISRGELQLDTGNFSIFGRTLVNQGTARWSFPNPGGSIGVAQGGAITNLAGATFDLAFDGNFVDGGHAGGFINLGSFRKSGGTNLANFTAPFQNQGLLRIEAGTLNLSGGGSHSGSVVITNLAQLSLGNGTHDWDAGSSISGPGAFRVSGGTANLAGSINVSGPHIFSGGTANLTGRYDAITNLVAVVGGTANFLGNGTIAPASLVISNLGVLGGTQSIEVADLVQIGLGTMQGSGSILSRGELQLTTGNFSIFGRTLVNQGTARWSFPNPGGSIGVAQGGAITNLAGATFDLAFDGNFVDGGHAGGFINLGSFRKSGGTNLANFTAPFHNRGLLQVEAGTLRFQGPFVQSAGRFVLAGGRVSSGGTLQFVGGSLTGSGRITGSVTNEATLLPGDARGALEIAGHYGQSESGRLELALGARPPAESAGSLVISNLATLNGTLAVMFTNGFVPPTNAVFEVMRHGERRGTFSRFLYPSNDVGMSLDYTLTNLAIRVTNVRPVIASLADQTLEVGQTLRVAVQASDADRPAQALTFALATAPAGVAINAEGVISWTPAATDAGLTTNITVTVSDNGTPSLSASASFRVTVGGGSSVTAVSIQPGVPAPGQCTLQFRGEAGTSYVTEYALAVMGPWFELATTVADASGTWQVVDAQATDRVRFYRVR